MTRKLFFSASLLLLSLPAIAQLPNCTKTNCGTIQANWSLVKGKEAIVCEGEDFQVRSGDSSPLGNIDDFHWYFIESNSLRTLFDTIVPDTSFVTYKYEVTDSIACLAPDGEIELLVALVVSSPPCTNGESCGWKLGSVKVKLLPRARFSVKNEICVNENISALNQSCHATEYFWDFGNGLTSSEKNPGYQFTQPGEYTIRLTVKNDCGSDTQTQRIRVVGRPDAAFSHTLDPANGCLPLVTTFTNQSNQWSNTVWEILPRDTNRWMFTDTAMRLSSRNIAVRFKAPGEYTVTLTADNVCRQPDKETTKITVFEPPRIKISSPGSFCDSKTISFRDVALSASGSIDSYEWTFENGAPSSYTGKEFPNVAFTRSGMIRLRATGPCGVLTDSARITIAATAPIRFGDNPARLCRNGDPVQLQAEPAGGSWRATGAAAGAITEGGRFNPAGLAPGSYPLTYSAGSAECPNEAMTTIEVLEAVSVTLAEAPPACDRLTYTPQPRYTGLIDRYRWTFQDGNPAASTAANPSGIEFAAPGAKQVVVAVGGFCGEAADTVVLNIQQSRPLAIDPLPGPLCSGSAPDTLRVNAPGGIWRGEGIIDARLGVFDPGRVAPGRTYPVTYELGEGACRNTAAVNIQVVQSQAVSVEDAIFCVDSAPKVIAVSPTGGTFAGPGVDSLSGLFDPARVGAGRYTVRYFYTDANNCSVSGAGEVLVEALPVINLRRDTVDLCRSDIPVNLAEALSFSATPPGGSSAWSGPGVGADGLFRAGNLAEGLYVLTVRYQRNACAVADSAVVRVVQASPLVLSPDTTVCISAGSLQLRANLGGGRWSGGPGIDPLSGRIDLAQAGGGIFTYRYVYQENTSCEQRGETSVEIIDLSRFVNAGPPVQLCEGPRRYTLGGAAPANGYWRGPALLDSLRGEVDLTQLTLDSTYTFQYCIESQQVQGCSACSSRSFRINANPTAAFAIDGLPCVNTDFSLINNSSNATRYEWTFGDGSSATAAAPTHRYTRQGTYRLQLIAVSAAGCRDTVAQDRYITTPPTARFTLDADEGCAPFELRVRNSSFGDGITQRWFIAGDTIAGPDPGRVFLDRITRDSVFRIVLAVENQCGVVFDEKNALVHPYPLVQFGISQDEGCSPLRIDFSNTTLGNPESYRWDTGNERQFTDSLPPPQVYTTGDSVVSTYLVTLIAANRCGADTLTKTITVFPPDVRAFIELDTLRGCQPLTLRLKSYSTPGARVSWLFRDEAGNERGSNETNPVATFDTPGRHMIILLAANCGAHADTAYLDVLPAPEVRFTHRPFICQGQPIDFLNGSTGISGSAWDFGDGQTSTERSPTHVFTTPGAYTVRLTGYSTLNDCPAIAESTLTVVGNPTARFTTSRTSGCAPLDIDFSNASQGNGRLSYRWDFGDGSSASFDENPSHRYERPGNYVATLTVFDADSCFADTSVINLLVFDDPLSRFTFEEKNYCLGHDTLYLRNASRDAVSYRWIIGGDTLRTRDVAVLPGQAGPITVQLIVQNSFQCADTSGQTVSVLPSPQAAFTASDIAGCQELTVRFTNRSADGDRYAWDFGNGNGSTSPSPAHTYRQAGAYVATLRVAGANGCPEDTARQRIEVYPKPTAGFTFAKAEECGTPATVRFQNTSQGQQANQWTFGDGSGSDETAPVYDYAGPGNYFAQLIVENTFGCRDTATQEIPVYGQPVAAFDVSEAVACEGALLRLINLSSQSLSYRWTIESLPPSTEAEPVLVFPQAGTYDIELIASYGERCRDTFRLTDAVRVYRSPEAAFTYRVDSLENVIGDVQFTNTSRRADRYRWDFGDGGSSTVASPLHVYDNNGPYEVRLIAFQDNGGAHTCPDTARQTIDPEWITTFYAPNAFAPEYGEGSVRVFRPVGIGIERYEIRVFSPWGEQVWRSTDLQDYRPSGEWDGRHDGEVVPQGAYTWVAEITFLNGNRRTVTGTVTVLR